MRDRPHDDAMADVFPTGRVWHSLAVPVLFLCTPLAGPIKGDGVMD